MIESVGKRRPSERYGKVWKRGFRNDAFTRPAGSRANQLCRRRSRKLRNFCQFGWHPLGWYRGASVGTEDYLRIVVEQKRADRPRLVGFRCTTGTARRIELHQTWSIHPPAEVSLGSTSAFCKEPQVASRYFSETSASIRPSLDSHGETHHKNSASHPCSQHSVASLDL